MKIGIVLSKTPAYSETFFVSKIMGLLKNKFEVVLYVQERAPGFDLCPVVEARKSKSIFSYFFAIWSTLKLLILHPKVFKTFLSLEKESKRPLLQRFKNLHNNYHILESKLDWLHFGFATIALQSENVAHAIGSKMAISLRGFDIDVYPETRPNCYKLLWTRVHKIHSISNYLIERAETFGMPKNSNVNIIYPALNIEKLPLISNKESIEDEQLKILTIARLHPIKGIGYVIDALKLLKMKGINFKYTVVGDGIQFKELKNKINALGLENEISLIGKQSHNFVFEMFNKANLYIQYSLSEGFCNAVLEAQAMKLLCIVSNGSGLVENVLNDETGFVIQKKNPQLLVQTIEKVTNLSHLEKMRITNAARDRVERKFNINKQEKEFLNFYKKI